MADKKIINLSKKRNKKTLKKIFSVLKIPIVILVVVAALFLSARLLGNVAVSNITDGIRNIKTLFSDGGGYPYPIEAFGYGKTVDLGGKPMIIYDGSCVNLSSSAGKVFEMPLTYANSKAVTKNGRALIFSNSSNSVILRSRTEQLGTVSESGPIVAAALAKNGSIATSHATDEYQSVLNVYNSRFKKIFEWDCAQERIADISLSSNGKKIAALAIGAENAEIYTRILIFSAGSDEPVADVKYSGTLFLKVVYTDSNRVIAVGDNRTVVLGKDGTQLDELIYSEDSISAVCSDGSGNTVVCYEEFGGSKSGIVRFSKSGKRTCSFSFDGVPECMDADGGKIALVSGKEIIVYSSTGKEQRRIETENSVSEIICCSGSFYTVESGEIHKY